MTTYYYNIHLAVGRILKYLISLAFYYSGILKLFNFLKYRFNLGQVKILAYHNISSTFPDFLDLSQSPELFEKRIIYLKENYDIISLKEAVEIVKNKTPLRRDKIVLTFDDNYKDYHGVVLPLKKKYQFEMTLFVAVDPLTNGEPLVFDGLVHAINATRKNQLDLTSYGLLNYRISTYQEKRITISNINEFFKKCNSVQRQL